MTAAARAALTSIAMEAGYAVDPDRLAIRGGKAAIASHFPFSDIATGAYGALALAAAEHHERRGGGVRPTPWVDRRRAGLALTGNAYLSVDQVPPKTWGNITGYHRCRDGYVYVHGVFPHLRDGLLQLFGAEDDRASVSARLADWSAADAEEAGQSRGLCVIRVRSREEWDAHPQRAALAARAALSVASSGTAAPSAPAASGPLPLSGVRVLDLSRVIAGPMAGRALAELGADVLRVSTERLPSIEGLVIDTGFGKRNTDIDLATEAGRAMLRDLVADADVFIDGYRPGALAAKGFGAEALAKLNPNIVAVTLSAFADIGPWAGRRGYDTYVQAGVGLTAANAPGEAPARLPCQPLDYLTGAFCAFGAVVGLIRRDADGGGARVEASLARTAMWLWQMADALPPEPSPPARNPTIDEVDAEGGRVRMETAFGAVAALAPPFGFEEIDIGWRAPPAPLGSAPPVWL